MYQKYQTEALVLGHYERGEADKMFALYTRDFGLVWARASGVRREGSRMRYALQTGVHMRTGLVRGKRGWRLAGGSAIRQLSGSTPGVAVFARICKLVMRLVQGEEQNAYLFEVLADAQATLSASERTILPTVEIVCVARVLYALGYLSEDALGSALLTHTAYGAEHLVEAEKKRAELLTSINRALSETQL